MKPDLLLLSSVAILSGCDLSLETDEINSSQHPISFVQPLSHNIDLDCSIDERAAPSSTVVTLSLSIGDMLWVAADSTVEYLEYPDGVLSGDLAQTYLACAPGTATDETPSTSAIVARGGQTFGKKTDQAISLTSTTSEPSTPPPPRVHTLAGSSMSAATSEVENLGRSGSPPTHS